MRRFNKTNSKKKDLQPANGGSKEVRRDNLKLINKDFRVPTTDDIPEGSAYLVVVPDFPEPKMTEDKGGRIHEQLDSSNLDL